MNNSFSPSADRTRDFRSALGQFTTGVTVITTNTPKGPMGITANSFASVSLDPPLILWSPAKSSTRFNAFEKAPEFAIHVLSRAQGELADRFVRTGEAFDDVVFETTAKGTPLFADCLARFTCSHHKTIDAGDHVLVLGQVTMVETNPGNPLVFCQGAFGDFAPAS